MASADLKDRQKDINLLDFSSKHYGVNWDSSNKAICCFPNHIEKTASLSYKEDGNYVSCFGQCQEKAVDIFKFVGIMEGLNCEDKNDFVDIMKMICEFEGIEYISYSKPLDAEKENLLNKKTAFAMEFKKELLNNKGGDAYNYLLNRGLTDKTIKNFHLGCTKMQNETRYSSYSKCNLSNRVSIPILTNDGSKVLAISFRDLNPENKNYKYVHDETDKVFKKSNIFYGYSHAKDFIRKRKHCYIVEGYFDMISMYQAGMENTLACMTSEMTEDQLIFLKKLVTNITVIIDQDQAGNNGFKKNLCLMLSYGFKVKVVPNLNFLGKDVNELCNKLKWNIDEIQSVINTNSQEGVNYFISSMLNKYDELMLEQRDYVLRATSILLNCIDDDITKTNYKSFIYRRLGM